MIALVNSRKKMYIATFSFLFFIITSLGGSYLAYRQYATELRTAQEHFSGFLIDIFNTNEKIADAISVRFLQQVAAEAGKRKAPYNQKEYDERNRMYGINMYAEKSDPSVQGTLQCVKAFPDEMLTLIKSIDYIFQNYSFGKSFSKREHYFYWNGIDCVYLLKHTPLVKYFFSAEVGHHFNIFEHTPNYNMRKFTSDPKQKGTVSTELYTDLVSHSVTYSGVSYVINLNEGANEKVMGALMYDNSSTDLLRDLRYYLQGLETPYLSVKMQSFTSDKVIFLIGDREFPLQQTSVLSKRYKVIFSVDPFLFLLLNPQAHSVYLISLILAISNYIFFVSYFKRHSKENVTDHLTGIYNRKALDFVHANNKKQKTLAIIDCNKFKAINDTWGHDMGDNALVHVADCLKQVIERHDAVVRLGGDEFCIIFEQRDLLSANAILRKANSLIKTFHNEIDFSISWGLSEIAMGEQNAEALKRADVELYKVKQARYAGEPALA